MKITVMELAVAAEGLPLGPKGAAPVKVGDAIERLYFEDGRVLAVKGQVVRVFTFNEYRPGHAS